MKTDYRIAHGTEQLNPNTGRWEAINFDDYDLVIESGSQSCGTKEYIVRKNTTDLSDSEIADICDRNNFGYARYGNTFRIYID